MTAGRRAAPWSAIVVLTLVGFGLRAFHMNAQSLWFDEIGSVTVATTPLADLVRAVETGGRVEPTAWLSTCTSTPATPRKTAEVSPPR